MTHGNYDYGSVMHYSRCGFSDNGYETISVKVHQHLPNFCKILSFLSFQGSATIGQRTGMSQTDVNKLMSFYGCWAEAPRVFNAKIKVCERASSASTIPYVCVSGLLALAVRTPQIYLIYVSHITYREFEIRTSEKGYMNLNLALAARGRSTLSLKYVRVHIFATKGSPE